MSDRSNAPTLSAAEDVPEGRSVRRGVQLAVAAYLMWGLLTIYWKQLGTFDAFELIAWRMMCAGVVMAIIVTARHSWPTIIGALRDPGVARRLVLASLLLTVNWGSYVWAVTNDRVIETALGYFIAPLATMAIGVFVLKEHPTTAQRAAFACAAVAVVILTVSYGRPPWIALVIAASWSVYGLTTRRVPLGAVDSLAGETFVLFVPAVIAVVVFSMRDGSVAQSADPREWLFVLCSGLVTAVPLMLFAGAAKSVPFTLLGPLNLLVPVINFGLGWLIYDEPMPAERSGGFRLRLGRARRGDVGPDQHVPPRHGRGGARLSYGHRMRQIAMPARWMACAGVAAAALSGCFTSTADYREKAESFIVEDAGIAEQLDVSLVSATCEEPADQEVGTTFTCTAIDEQGDTWSFDVEIAESNRIAVSESPRP